jgi:hypothetical protein
MANPYEMVYNSRREVVGLWFQDPGVANNKDLVLMLMYQEGLPMDKTRMIQSGNFRVVPNNFDNNGGCFVMFGSEKAPGEGGVSASRL